MANEMRLDFTAAERAKFYLAVMKEKGWTQAELCRELHLNPARVSKTLKVFDRLPPDLRTRIGDGPDLLPFRAAYALTDVSDPAVLGDLVDRVLNGRLRVESLEDEVARLKGKLTKGAEPVTVRLPTGAALTIPAAVTWEAIQAIGRQLLDAAARGLRNNLAPGISRNSSRERDEPHPPGRTSRVRVHPVPRSRRSSADASPTRNRSMWSCNSDPGSGSALDGAIFSATCSSAGKWAAARPGSARTWRGGCSVTCRARAG